MSYEEGPPRGAVAPRSTHASLSLSRVPPHTQTGRAHPELQYNRVCAAARGSGAASVPLGDRHVPCGVGTTGATYGRSLQYLWLQPPIRISQPLIHMGQALKDSLEQVLQLLTSTARPARSWHRFGSATARCPRLLELALQATGCTLHSEGSIAPCRAQ